MKTYLKKCRMRGEVGEYFTLELLLDGKRVSFHTSVSECYIDNLSMRWMLS